MLMFFCFKQKTAYGMRISDWSSDVCSSDRGCCLKELFRQQGTLGGIRAGEVLPEKGVQALMPDARTRHDRFCEASLQAPMDIHRRQTGRLGHIISGHS